MTTLCAIWAHLIMFSTPPSDRPLRLLLLVEDFTIHLIFCCRTLPDRHSPRVCATYPSAGAARGSRDNPGGQARRITSRHAHIDCGRSDNRCVGGGPRGGLIRRRPSDARKCRPTAKQRISSFGRIYGQHSTRGRPVNMQSPSVYGSRTRQVTCAKLGVVKSSTPGVDRPTIRWH